MERTCTLLLTIATTIHLLAQAPPLTWAYPYGGSAADMARDMRTLPDGGAIVVGGSRSANGDVSGNQGMEDLWAIRLDAAGALVWEVAYGGSLNDRANAVDLTADGGFILAGESVSSDGDVQPGTHGSFDFWVVRLDAQGQLMWQRSYGGSSADVAEGVRSTADGGAIVIGYSESSNGDVTSPRGGRDIWVVKLAANGDLQWQRNYGSIATDDGMSIITAADGGYLFTGQSFGYDGDVSGQHGQGDLVLGKIDATGSIQWIELYGGGQMDMGIDLLEMADGTIMVAGVTQSNDGDVSGGVVGHGQEVWVLKVSSSGALIWERNFGGVGAEASASIAHGPDGGVVVAGRTNMLSGDVTVHHGGFDLWVLGVTASGQLGWQRSFGGSGYETAMGVDNTPDGGYIVAGYSESNGGDVQGAHGDADYWVLKLGGSGTGVQEQQLRSLQLRPNPAHDQLFVSPMDRAVPYRILDVNGRLVLHGTLQHGAIDVRGLRTGVYTLLSADPVVLPARFVVER